MSAGRSSVPPMPPTPAHRLADIMLGANGPLVDWLAARRPERSWQRLSLELAQATDHEVTVHPDTLQAWFAESETAVARDGAA